MVRLRKGGDRLTMEYVRKAYGVPAKRGMMVEAYYKKDGKWLLAARGRITSASYNIHINGVPFHPTHNVVYFDKDGSILMDTREVTE